MKNCQTEKILDAPYYTEGPAVDNDGNVYYTTLTGGYIGKWEVGKGSMEWAKGECPNGQILGPDGDHWVCESQSGRIARYSSAGSFRGFPVETQLAGVHVGVPNDLILSRSGDLYFTDSTRYSGRVFRVDAKGNEKVLAEDIDYANGLALSSDESVLYVAESYRNRILAIGLKEEACQVRVFADLPSHPGGDSLHNLPDGLAVDKEGRIWVAHYGMQAIQVLSPEGEHLYSLDTQLPLTSNLCFWKDEPTLKVLVVTGGFQEPGPGAVMKMTVSF